MAQFDVYRLRNGSLAIDCQSDTLAELNTRFVAPLRPLDPGLTKQSRLVPTFEIGGTQLMMLTTLVRAIDVRDIQGTVVSLLHESYRIQGALDVLITGI